MRKVFLGLLCLVMLGLFAPAVFAARSDTRGKTIKDLSGTMPLGVFKRSVGPKFYQSLLVSPLEDWSVVRARIAGGRVSDARVIRSSVDPAYNSLALKFAKELTFSANDSSGRARQADSALIHLLIYQIADGVMAVSFAHPEAAADQQIKSVGRIRLSVKKNEGPWTEIKASETQEEKRSSLHERGRRLRRMDRMPMDASSGPPR